MITVCPLLSILSNMKPIMAIFCISKKTVVREEKRCSRVPENQLCEGTTINEKRYHVLIYKCFAEDTLLYFSASFNVFHDSSFHDKIYVKLILSTSGVQFQRFLNGFVRSNLIIEVKPHPIHLHERKELPSDASSEESRSN